MLISKKQLIIWDYFIVILFAFTSNSIIWFQLLTPGVAFVIFLIVALLNTKLFSKRVSAIRPNKIFWAYFAFVCTICLVGLFTTYGALKENSMFGYIVGMLGSYFIISRYDFFYFRKLITNIVYTIVLIGIPVFIMTEYDLLPLQNILNYEMFFIYSIGWPYHFHRFAGIWHEPGACQIILNSILWLYIYEIRNWTLSRKELLKLFVIVVGILFTQSTMGYIVLMLFGLTCIWKLKLKKKFKYVLYPLLVIAIGFAIHQIIYSDVIQDKFDDDNQSKALRTLDNISLSRMTFEEPIIGYGLGTERFWSRSTYLGNTHCSNGLLTVSASLGLIWLFVFIIMTYQNIKKMNLGVPTIFVLIAFILMQSNERFMEYPITFLFVFSFYSYNRIVYINGKSIVKCRNRYV